MLVDGRLTAMPVLSEQPRRVDELLAKYPEMDAVDASHTGGTVGADSPREADHRGR